MRIKQNSNKQQQNYHIFVPCSPNQFIQSSQCLRSPFPTEGFTFFKAYLKSSIFKGTLTYFSNSYIHFPSVSFFPKPPYRFNFLLIGMQAASRHRFAMSAPEYPSVCFTISSKSISSVFSFFKFILMSSLLPTYVGKGMYILFSNLLLIAQSKSQGLFVAPTTTISFPSSAPVEAPSIRVINSVFTFLLASSSFQPLFEAKASIQSMKIVVGEQNFAISKSILTNFYDSPFHLDAKLDAVTLKNVVFPEEAMALASKVFPVPGGPKSKTPFHALLIPLKSCGIANGNNTASSSTSLAFYSSAMSSNVMFGLKSTTSRSNMLIKSASGPAPSGQQLFKNDFFSSSPGFFLLTLASHGLLQSLLSLLLLLLQPTMLLFFTGLGCWYDVFLTVFTGFLGHISASLYQNYFYLYALYRSSLSTLYFYLLLYISSSS